MKANETRKGLLFVFLAAVCFSIGGLLIKMIPWNAMSINGWRCGISMCILLLFAKVSGHKLKLTRGVVLGALAMCLREEDLQGLQQLLTMPTITAKDLSAALEVSWQAGFTAATALLLEKEHRMLSAGRRRDYTL